MTFRLTTLRVYLGALDFGTSRGLCIERIPTVRPAPGERLSNVATLSLPRLTLRRRSTWLDVAWTPPYLALGRWTIGGTLRAWRWRINLWRPT